jgi:aromatic-L-amino-acid/L-tryptophan decarboxylase
MTPEEFRKRSHQIVDWIADYREGIADRAVASRSAPGEVSQSLPPEPPQQPEPFDAILRDLESIVMPGLSHWAHPRFFGYFPSNSDLASVLGDYLSTGLGVLGLTWQASPALTELEDVTTGWVRQMVGLSEQWQGVIQDTASTSTLVALILARERLTAGSFEHGGLQSAPQPLVVYASDGSHSSVTKAARLAGFGDDNVRLIPHDAHGSMRVDLLRAAMTADRRAGKLPCAIVATTGSTATTSLDPIDAIAALAEPHGLWLHVDAAMAGSAMILPECRWMWHGVERADSVVLNPHKWLGAAFDCSLYYVRDPAHLIRVMGTSPSYLRSAADTEVRHLRDWGIPLGRRFRALKLWCLIRDSGVTGLQARLRRDLANARWLASVVQREANWQVTSPVVLQTVCVRHAPPGLDAEAVDRHTRDWVDRVNRSGTALITPAQFEGRWIARVSIGAITTEREHVAQAWSAMRQAAGASLSDVPTP